MSLKAYCREIRGEILGTPFPKRCTCGRRFYGRIEYLEGTSPNKRKPLFDYKVNNQFVVKEFRDCSNCGFTMMIRIKDRRDQSEAGDRRREMYDNLYSDLIKKGIEHFDAREQTLEAVRATM